MAAPIDGLVSEAVAEPGADTALVTGVGSATAVAGTSAASPDADDDVDASCPVTGAACTVSDPGRVPPAPWTETCSASVGVVYRQIRKAHKNTSTESRRGRQ